MGMPTTSIAENPTSSAPVQSQSGGKGGGKGMGATTPSPQSIDQGYRAKLQADQSQAAAQEKLKYQSTVQGSSAMPPSGVGKNASNSTIQPSNMTVSSTSGQPTIGQPNPYPNTTGSWDNSSTQQPSAPMGGGKGKG